MEMMDGQKGAIHAVLGDITTLHVDAIVNAANSGLRGGGGVDGAIHRAAGPELLKACRPLGGCPTGQAVATEGFDLPAKWVIHAVGPVWRGGTSGEAKLLRSAYRRSLEEAEKLGARSIAFPAISCGVYRFPLEQACTIAVDTVRTWVETNDLPSEVTLCCFDERTLRVYEQELAR